MAEYIKEKWSADFPDRAGQEVRPTEAVENTLDYDGTGSRRDFRRIGRCKSM